MSTTSYNQAIEDAAQIAETWITAVGVDGEIWIARRIADDIRALRQPASDTPDPRDEVIAELREALEALVACDLCNGSLGLADSADTDGRPYQSQQLADQLEAARAALSKGEGAKSPSSKNKQIGKTEERMNNIQMTLGKLIKELEGCDPSAPIRFSDDRQFPGDAISYRGYYCDLAFEPTAEPSTAGQMLNECKQALGQTFVGYKGGNYMMGEDTPLWIASYGEASSRAIMGLESKDNEVVLMVEEID